MASEKLKYILNSEPHFPAADYDDQLNQALSTLPDGSAISMLMELLRHDQGIRYELISRLIPLSFNEMMLLLKSFIQIQKDGRGYISEPSENEVRRITDALIERGRTLMSANECVGAAEIGFAILLIIEAEMSNVYDEGITCQAIIEETFQYLSDVIESKNLESEAKALIFEKGIGHYESRMENDRFYDDEWQELIDKLK